MVKMHTIQGTQLGRVEILFMSGGWWRNQL